MNTNNESLNYCEDKGSTNNPFPNGVDPEFENQLQKFYRFLKSGWYTCREIESQTKIRQTNCTEYWSYWKSKSLLWEAKEKQKCSITGRRVNKLTTNKDLAILDQPERFNCIQSKLF